MLYGTNLSDFKAGDDDDDDNSGRSSSSSSGSSSDNDSDDDGEGDGKDELANLKKELTTEELLEQALLVYQPLWLLPCLLLWLDLA